MLLIFYLSSQVVQRSNKLSTGITQIVIKVVKIVSPDSILGLDGSNHLVRKNAHFFAYLILGTLVMNALKRSRVTGFRVVIFTLVICVLYATSDEVHQLFVPGRGGQVKDVLIDSSGALLGITLFTATNKFMKKKSSDFRNL